MKRAVVAAVFVLVACGVDDSTGPGPMDAPSAAVAAAANSWLKRADYPVNVYYAASAAITNASNQSTLYVIGGKPRVSTGEGSISNAVKAYNVSANTWTSKAPLPVRIRSSNGAVVVDGKIYLSGGFTRRFDEKTGFYQLETLKSLYVYNPASNTWARKRDMPIATVNGVSGTYGGKLYVATSCYDSSYCGETIGRGALFRYNPANDNWVLLTRTPHDPWSAGGGFIGSKFYLLTGFGDLDVFDVTTNTWSTGPKRPIRFCQPSYATLKAKLYLAGCHADDDASGVYPMLVFNPAAGAWSQAAAPPVVVNHDWTLSRVVVSGSPRLELVGGDVPGNNWQYVP
jgi:N-acetylneuraminic acid mutarotase